MSNLITGGAGFIGSHLVDRLMKKGEYVICLDNLSTGNIKNINHWLNNSKFTFIKHDITKKIDLKVQKIWHLASPASPLHYQKNPIETAKTNFIGTYNILEIARKHKAKFLFASTSEIYGNPEVYPQNEEYYGHVNPTGLRSCYNEGKRIAESLCFDYFRKYNLNISIGRIFNTYGPRMMPNDGRVISNFISRALENKCLYVNGSGNQSRAFCYIDDLIDALIKLMDSDFEGPINIGNPNCELSILKLANIIRKKLNHSLEIKNRDLPENDPIKRKPDISKANNLLHWEPSINFEEGLDKTIEYFKLKN